MSGTPARVLVAHGHAPARAGVRGALTGHGFEIVAEAADAGHALASAADERPDVCLIDVRLPGGGIRAAGRIAALAPAPAVVMLADAGDDEELFEALRAGAVGYLLQETDPARLPHAVRGVLRGEAALPRTLTARLIGEFRAQSGARRLALPDGRVTELTPREAQVLGGVRAGESTRAMAERLGVSEVTVRRHVSTLLAKLGVRDRAGARELLRP